MFRGARASVLRKYMMISAVLWEITQGVYDFRELGEKMTSWSAPGQCALQPPDAPDGVDGPVKRASDTPVPRPSCSPSHQIYNKVEW